MRRPTAANVAARLPFENGAVCAGGRAGELANRA
jgi:hypothetical protein